MPLVTPQGELAFKTKFKSLPFGYDKPGKGANNGTLGQPFVVKDHNNISTEDLGKTGGPDVLTRGGLLTPIRSLEDASRLTQLFAETPAGRFFTVKQNLLSRTGTDIDGGYPLLASPLKVLNGPLNEGIYNPLSTLGQALVNAGGIHLFKQGINPLTGGPKYETMIAPAGAKELGIANKSLNRLIFLYRGDLITPGKITTKSGNEDNILFRYNGGPGSILGVGKTTIFAKNRTQFSGTKVNIINSRGYSTFSQQQIADAPRVGDNADTLVQDFRKSLDKKPYSIISDSPDYKTKNLEQRVKAGNPGARGVDRSNYTRGIVDSLNRPQPLDQINALYLYKSENVTKDSRKNDFVKFRIATIDNNNPSEKVFSHFRAFINSFSDSMSSQWNNYKYMGRGEDFYSYQGFNNQISMDFTVVAQSVQELSIMYQKLNYLKSTLAPDYSDSGYMRGNIHQLTMGGYLYETPGIIDSLTYTIPNDTTWEIGIPASVAQSTEARGSNGFTDSVVKELAHRINVSMTFTPIYKFLPQKVKNINAAGNIKQRFISLEDDAGTNNLYANGVSNVFRASDHQIIGDPQNQPTPSEAQLDAIDAEITDIENLDRG